MINELKDSLRWMHGTGNRFAIIDRSSLAGFDEVALARSVGEWVDGLLVVHPGDESSDLVMRVINADGSRADMCGNGLRCIAFDACRRDAMRGSTMRIRVGAHVARARVRELPSGDPMVHVWMPSPQVTSKSGYLHVSLGNEHGVFIHEVMPSKDEWASRVHELHQHGLGELNLHAVRILDSSHVEMRSWERGVGPTSACASGATAVVSALASRQQVSSMVSVSQPGGELLVRWRGSRRHPVNMGPVGLIPSPVEKDI